MWDLGGGSSWEICKPSHEFGSPVYLLPFFTNLWVDLARRGDQ